MPLVPNKDFPTLQNAEAQRHVLSQNSNSNTSPSKDVQERSDLHGVTIKTEAFHMPTECKVQDPKTAQKKILKMKIIPPFRKEHFTKPLLIEKDVKEAYNAIMAMFEPKNRIKITISRTNIMKNGHYFQILLVTAPAEAEEDISRVKTRGLRIMGRTVFPTGEESWQHVNSEFPKRLIIRMNNLSALCEDETVEELMDLPEGIEMADYLKRETQQTDWGPAFSGRAHVPIIVNNKEEQEMMKEWSFQRSYENVAHQNDDPVHMSIPVLHSCSLCESENRRHLGHDAAWCRIYRRPKAVEQEEQVEKALENPPIVDPEIATTGPISQNQDPQNDNAKDSDCDKINGTAESDKSDTESEHEGENASEESAEETPLDQNVQPLEWCSQPTKTFANKRYRGPKSGSEASSHNGAAKKKKKGSKFQPLANTVK